MCPFRSSYDRVLKLVARWRLIRFFKGFICCCFSKRKMVVFYTLLVVSVVRSFKRNERRWRPLFDSRRILDWSRTLLFLAHQPPEKEGKKKPTEFSFFLVESFLPLVVTSLASSICKHFFQKFKWNFRMSARYARWTPHSLERFLLHQMLDMWRTGKSV